MYYGAWDVFVHSAFFSGLLILLVGLLFVGWLIWAESQVQSEPPRRERWDNRVQSMGEMETRKLRTPLR
jgi:hypothetical protein